MTAASVDLPPPLPLAAGLVVWTRRTDSMTASHYRPGAAPDYSHRLHAGNVGDVWKHCALVEVLRRLAGGPTRVAYLDVHAGEGAYALGPTGEWSDGIGRLWQTPAGGDDPVSRYVTLCHRLGTGADRPARYPGSPVLARAVLGADATLSCWERDPTVCERLGRRLASDSAARVVCDDGLRALANAIGEAETRADAVAVLVDPPWAQKADWTAIPDALARACIASTRACFLLWYPVKSLTRPNAMITRLATAGVSGTIAELVTTPLDQKRRGLNGSGVLLVRPPSGASEALAAAAPVLGAACARQPGVWSFRMQAWTSSPAHQHRR